MSDDWQRHAACLGMDPAVFFPEHGESTAEAKRVCGGCPVREPCLAYALGHDDQVGVWGGTAARERLVLLGRRKPKSKQRSTGLGFYVRLGGQQTNPY